MDLKIKRWGNSQGIIIPKKILKELNMPLEGNFNAKVEHGKLVLKPDKLKRVVIVCEKPNTARYFEQMVERFGEDLPFNVVGIMNIQPNVNPFKVLYHNNFNLTKAIKQIKNNSECILDFVADNNISSVKEKFTNFKQQLNDLQPDFIINGAPFSVNTFIVQLMLTLAGYDLNQVEIAKFEDFFNSTLFNAMFHTSKATYYFNKDGELTNKDLLKEIEDSKKKIQLAVLIGKDILNLKN